MEWIAVDVMGPLPNTESGRKYILIVSDYHCWINCERVHLLFWSPSSNQFWSGVETFELVLFTEMCWLLGIKKTRPTPYHPQSDGMAKGFNQALEIKLSKFVDLNQKDCDTCIYIPYLLMAYHSAIHDTISCSPVKLMLGREVKLSIDVLFGCPTEEIPMTATDSASSLQKLETAHDFAHTHLKVMSDLMNVNNWNLQLLYSRTKEQEKSCSQEPSMALQMLLHGTRKQSQSQREKSRLLLKDKTKKSQLMCTPHRRHLVTSHSMFQFRNLAVSLRIQKKQPRRSAWSWRHWITTDWDLIEV